MTRSIPWLRALVEGVVIVGSIMTVNSTDPHEAATRLRQVRKADLRQQG